MAGKRNRNRPDQNGVHRGAFERNKKKIYATQTVCGICGKPVDFNPGFPRIHTSLPLTIQPETLENIEFNRILTCHPVHSVV